MRKIYKTELITPDYYSRFQCVGSECRGSCCKHLWGIAVDKQTYKLYRSAKVSPELSEVLKKYVKRSADTNNDHQYGYIVQTVQDGLGACPMETPEGLCSIQLELGPDALCVTCKKYPRSENRWIQERISNRVERSMSISCEQVVKLLMEQREPIQFNCDLQELSLNQFELQSVSLNLSLRADARPLNAYYPIIRAYCVGVLQERQYSFEDRLILLLVLLDKLQKAATDKAYHTIPAICEAFAAAVEQHEYDKLLQPISSVFTGGFFSYFLVLEVFLPTATKNHLWKRLVANLDIKDGTVQSKKRGDMNKAFSHIPHFTEQLFVNTLFRDGVPYNSSSLWDAGRVLAGEYMMYKLLVELYMGDAETLSDEEIIDLTAYYGKCLLHNFKRAETILKKYNAEGYTTLAHMAVLLKS